MDPLSWGALIYGAAMSWGLAYGLFGQRRQWREDDAPAGRHRMED